MTGEKLKQSDFPSHKEYLVALAILYIREHTGYIGMNDEIFFDNAECDWDALADDLEMEFDLEIV